MCTSCICAHAQGYRKKWRGKGKKRKRDKRSHKFAAEQSSDESQSSQSTKQTIKDRTLVPRSVDVVRAPIKLPVPKAGQVTLSPRSQIVSDVLTQSSPTRLKQHARRKPQPTSKSAETRLINRVRKQTTRHLVNTSMLMRSPGRKRAFESNKESKRKLGSVRWQAEQYTVASSTIHRWRKLPVCLDFHFDYSFL